MSRPRVVVLCGSSRFRDEFDRVAERLTLEGAIVLMPHVWPENGSLERISERDRVSLNELHLYKIDCADEMLVINPGGYVGASCAKEIEYATRAGVPVEYTCPPPVADRTRAGFYAD